MDETKDKHHPPRRVRITGCIECGTSFSAAKLDSMSKFLGWTLGGHTVRSDQKIYFTLLEEGVRANFLLGTDLREAGPKLVSASIHLDAAPHILDKFRCADCHDAAHLGAATCVAQSM